MTYWLLVIGVVAVFVFAILLLVPALDVWRDDRRKRRRGGMLP